MRSQQHLRGTVPQGDHLMGVCPDWDAKGTSQTKISNLQCAILVNQEILWFKVAVENTSLVAEEHPFHQLIQVALSSGRRENDTYMHAPYEHTHTHLDKHWVQTAVTRYAVKVLL